MSYTKTNLFSQYLQGWQAKPLGSNLSLEVCKPPLPSNCRDYFSQKLLAFCPNSGNITIDGRKKQENFAMSNHRVDY